MKKVLVAFFIVIGFAFSCEDKEELDLFDQKVTDSSTREEDDELLSNLYQRIQNMAGSFDCIDAGEWDFTPYGSKACGGPAGYIAYSSKIDTDLFLRTVNFYSEQQDIYNTKWGIVSDCSLPPQPKAVKCVDGKPELVY